MRGYLLGRVLPLLFLIILSGCSEDENSIEQAVLGSSEQAFIDTYGENAIDDEDDYLIDYQSGDGYVGALFYEGHAVFIVIDFSGTESTVRTEEEALEAAEEFMPTDATYLEDETISLGEEAMAAFAYESADLADHLTQNEESSQSFSISLHGQVDQYESAVIQLEE